MAVKPSITWIGSPNFGYPDQTHGGLDPQAIVYHIAQGSMTGLDAWFNNPNSYASTHFGVAKSGAIHQYVAVGDAAWGNGVINQPDLSIPWLANCYNNGINPNLKTISIEHEGFTGQPWPEAQYQASRRLVTWLIDTYNLRHTLVKLDHGHIGHYRIDSVNRKNCPGTGWPRSRLLQDLGRLEDVYVPKNRVLYDTKTFAASASGYSINVNVIALGFPSQATAVELFVGCRSRGDGAYVAAYDGTSGRLLDRMAVYPTAPLRRDWNFGRGRVQLTGSSFQLRIHPAREPVDVIAVLKGYYTLE
jgi:N-acetylmuramoyl-L-alanine amidase